MKRMTFILCILSALLIHFVMTPAYAGEVDVLINKLVEKGILNHKDATDILKEIQKEGIRQEKAVKDVAQEAAKEAAKETAKEVAQKETKKASLEIPKWVNKIKVKGDFRLRYQGQETENSGNPHRSRERIRWRVGVVADVTDQWEAGFGLASGGTDPRSTNQTLRNTFETGDARLDYAYAKWTPMKNLFIEGGKFKNPLWQPKDLLWDGDIRPDGAAAKYKRKLMSNLSGWITPAFFILDEDQRNTAQDPFLFLVQPGVTWKINKHVYLKAAGAWYSFHHLAGNPPLAYSAGTNSTNAAGNLFYDYDSLAGDAELGFLLNKDWPIPFVALFGQIVKSDADEDLDNDGYTDDMGYLLGIKFGDKKVKKFGQWQAKYSYRHLERDAWPDALPDSDFYNGETNVKGSEMEFKFGLAKNVALGLDYYRSKPIRVAPGTAVQKQKLLQVDLKLKW